MICEINETLKHLQIDVLYTYVASAINTTVCKQIPNYFLSDGTPSLTGVTAVLHQTIDIVRWEWFRIHNFPLVVSYTEALYHSGKHQVMHLTCHLSRSTHIWDSKQHEINGLMQYCSNSSALESYVKLMLVVWTQTEAKHTIRLDN